MNVIRRSVPFNPGSKLGLVIARREPSLRKLNAVVHHDCIWINGCPVGGISRAQLKRLVKLLLDDGVKIIGMWPDVSYAYIDKRIGK